MTRWMMAAALASVAMAGSAHAQPVPVNLAPLDANTVTTGGTAVTAVNHYSRLKGGWLQNPAGGSFYGSRLMGWSSVVAGATGTLPDLGVSGTQTFGACPGTFPSPAFADNTALPYIVMGY